MCKSIYSYSQRIPSVFFALLESFSQSLILMAETPSAAISRVGVGVTHNYISP